MPWLDSSIALMHALSSHGTVRRSARLMGEEHALHSACVGRVSYRGGGAKRVAPDWALLSTWADRSSKDTSLRVRAHHSGLCLDLALLHVHMAGRAVSQLG